MDSETHTDEEFQPGLGATTPGSTSRAIQTFSTAWRRIKLVPSRRLYSSHGVFSGSQHFTVTGGTFTNVTNTFPTVATVPPDFRVVPFGDLDLQREIQLECAVDRHTARRVHCAQVVREICNATVAMYQGDGAEEVYRISPDAWRDNSARMAARCCNCKIYGATQTLFKFTEQRNLGDTC
ncbi:hypothetical protein DFH08DRAFT_899188 [Mycena albidolilacea]|uniref:Uncharacterized protein n=1 Tax=Mycena albidolilacea TaxID=1033008 RepID=A0AAD7EC93_9AGAR|nr:hypothetical protein DFH08DRAFT_899188 [Mycena albidolilacea]